jgi:hypothetical protein
MPAIQICSDAIFLAFVHEYVFELFAECKLWGLQGTCFGSLISNIHPFVTTGNK